MGSRHLTRTEAIEVIEGILVTGVNSENRESLRDIQELLRWELAKMDFWGADISKGNCIDSEVRMPRPDDTGIYRDFVRAHYEECEDIRIEYGFEPRKGGIYYDDDLGELIEGTDDC